MSKVIEGFAADGQIHADSILKAIKKYKALLKENTQQMELFEKYDVNHSGVLEPEQLMKLLNDVYAPQVATMGDVEYVLSICDTNQNGAIDPEELAPAIATWLDLAKEIPPEEESSKNSSSLCILL